MRFVIVGSCRYTGSGVVVKDVATGSVGVFLGDIFHTRETWSDFLRAIGRDSDHIASSMLEHFGSL